ncbi:hypothetical protein FRB90_005002 [Tulasnella sp. 427]|nr:hypothetical protein FRB90_005002 [Tulasnella sp. 427]
MLTKLNAAWNEVPFYVVGQKTADTLMALAALRPALYPSPDYVLGAAATGSGDKLASFIIKSLLDKAERSSVPILYLTGDKNRDTVETALANAHIAIQACQVYQTSARPALSAEIKDAVARLPSHSVDDIWVAFFAPSSAKMALPALGEVLNLPNATVSGNSSHLRCARFAAIGKTTSTYLVEEHATKFRMEAVAATPTAEGLADAIRSCVPVRDNTDA